MGTPTKIITIRAPKDLTDRVRQIARCEAEPDSVIVRRLLRRGLELEQRSQRQPSGEAA